MKSIQLVLWAVSLGLQLLMLMMLFRRRLARVVPVFSGLIAFYVLRSAVLYILSFTADPGDLRNTYDVLATIDLVLQIALFIEIVLRSPAWSREGARPGWGVTAIQLLVQGVIAGGVTYFMPENTRVQVDRGVVFVAVLMILQLGWMVWRRVSGVPLAICAGFALYGTVATAAVYVQNLAVENRGTVVFAVAAYAKGLVYIGIVVFWILALRVRTPSPRARGRASRRPEEHLTASSR